MILSLLIAMAPLDHEGGVPGAEPTGGPTEVVEFEVGDDGNVVPAGREPEAEPEPVEPQETPQREGEPTPRRTRRTERGRGRYAELSEQNKRLQTQLQELVEVNRARDLQLAEMRGALGALPRYGDSPIPPAQARIKDLRERRNAIESEFKSLPDEQKIARWQEYQTRLDDLEDERIAVVSAAHVPAPPDPEQTAREVRQRQLAADNPDIFASKTARALAQSIMIRRTQVEKKPYTTELANEVFEETRRELGMASRSLRTPTQGQRVATSGSRGTGDAAGGGGRTIGVPWDESTEAMARALYPEISDPAKRKEKWMTNYAKQTAADRSFR